MGSYLKCVKPAIVKESAGAGLAPFYAARRTFAVRRRPAAGVGAGVRTCLKTWHRFCLSLSGQYQEQPQA
jgi:hypothetical protein